jgi:hypothetical protein
VSQKKPGRLILSLDFELLWGVLDKDWREEYRPVVLEGRAAIARMLELFSSCGLKASWAAVGLALCSGRDEALGRLGALAGRTVSLGMSLGRYIAERTGADEASDPAHYAPGLAAAIAATPGQELASHTFSHYHAMEEGSSPEGFSADLKAFKDLARDKGWGCASIVLPRNQIRPDFLALMAQAGVRAYRGTPPGSMLDGPRAEASQSKALRALRLAEAYLPLASRRRLSPRPLGGALACPVDVPASRFFRPCLSGSRALEGLRVAKILAEMRLAARSGMDYHLWWHPHNMGMRPDLAMEMLARVADGYKALNASYGFKSSTMAEAAGQREQEP